jgi:hypothetical protein
MAPRETLVFLSQNVAKGFQGLPAIRRAVRLVDPVVQVNFDFPQTFRLQLRQPLQQRRLVLLGGIKIGVAEARAVAILNRPADRAGLFVPVVQAGELLSAVQDLAILIPAWLKMIGHNDDQVARVAPINRPPKTLLGAPQRITT